MENKLLLLIVFAVFLITSISIVSGIEQGQFLHISGNASELHITLNTSQVTINPEIGDNITYVTWVNISTPNAEGWNISSFTYVLPDNWTTSVVTDFKLHNETNTTGINATAFGMGAINHVNFSGTCISNALNWSRNMSSFNITFVLHQPLASTKIATSQSGRAYTETWNITSAATNLTVVNASLILIPDYWYTRIGNPSVQFNSTTKYYVANYTTLRAYTDLNLSDNIYNYGSGWGTLSLTYNGPTVDSSTGSSSSKVTLAVIPEAIRVWLTPRGVLFFSVGLLAVGGIVTLVIFLVRKYK